MPVPAKETPSTAKLKASAGNVDSFRSLQDRTHRNRNVPLAFLWLLDALLDRGRGSVRGVCRPLAGWLSRGDVELVPGVDRGDVDDQRRERRLVVMPGDLVGDGSARSASRVAASVSASAARSASLK